VIERVLSEYAAIPYSYGKLEKLTVFDRARDRYLLMVVGDDYKEHRVHSCLIHVDVRGDDVVIQRDGTEDGVAPDLIRGGIPAARIVLAFHLQGPKRYSEFLAA
jgi:hypothetical protein